jgi:hypothetical protein
MKRLREPIDEESGRQLAEWARGGTPAPTKPATNITENIPTAADYVKKWTDEINAATSRFVVYRT